MNLISTKNQALILPMALSKSILRMIFILSWLPTAFAEVANTDASESTERDPASQGVQIRPRASVENAIPPAAQPRFKRWQTSVLGGFRTVPADGVHGDWEHQTFESPALRIGFDYVHQEVKNWAIPMGGHFSYLRSREKMSSSLTTSSFATDVLSAGATIGARWEPSYLKNWALTAEFGLSYPVFSKTELASKGFSTEVQLRKGAQLLSGAYASYQPSAQYRVIAGPLQIESKTHIMGGIHYVY